MNEIPVKVPFVDLACQHQKIQPDIDRAMEAVIKKGDFILGQAVAELETAFAQACGVEYGVGVGSGTDAIALGLRACGIGTGDEVLLPANTFIATIIGVLQAEATPILVDCDSATALIDLEAAASKITRKTKAILPVHLYGQMVSPLELLKFAHAYNLLIFEDAAQAHLAAREDYTAASVGKAAAFSFYPSKNLGAFGDGGMVVTGDEEIAHKVRSFRNYGASRKYFQTDLGINSRLDTLQAAILNVKLPYLPSWNQTRNQAAQQYKTYLQPLKSHGISPIANYSGAGHIYHLYVIRLNKACPVSRDEIQAKLAEVGIQTGIHYPIPCHLQPAYRFLGYQVGDFPQTETLCEQILSLPMYPGLRQSQIKLVCEELSRLCCP